MSRIQALASGLKRGAIWLQRQWLDERPATLTSYALLGLALGLFALVFFVVRHPRHRLAGTEDILSITGVVLGAQFAYVKLINEVRPPRVRVHVANVLRWPAYRWKTSLRLVAACAGVFGLFFLLREVTNSRVLLWLTVIDIYLGSVIALGPLCRLLLPRRYTSPVGKDAAVDTLDRVARSPFGERWAGAIAVGFILAAYVIHFVGLYASGSN